MPRSLSVSRVTVAPEQEAEYLATVRKLATLVERRGQRLWVFRNSKRAHTFIEFSESPSAMSHRAHASRTPDELKLEMKLQSLASYAPDAWELWEEMPLEAPRSSEGWKAEGEPEE